MQTQPTSFSVLFPGPSSLSRRRVISCLPYASSSGLITDFKMDATLAALGSALLSAADTHTSAAGTIRRADRASLYVPADQTEDT